MDRRRNLLIGIVVGLVLVGALVYVTGLTKELLSPFRSSSSTYKTSEAATAPDLASGDWINSEPLKLKDRRAVASLGIRYPVVTDNDYQTWKAYHVEAWPTTFLLDKKGRIRWMHVGEGGYDEAERLIQKFLAENDT